MVNGCAGENSRGKPLTSVMEDYLEAIFDLSQDKRVIRVKDIARRMDVKMPTVTSMLKTLNERGMVHYEKYEYVELTEEGVSVGREMRRRHEILREFLTEILRVDFATADEDACKMEHALSPAALDSLTDFIEFIRTCPRTGESWLNYFEEYRLHGHRPDKCQARSTSFSCEFKHQLDSEEGEAQ
ncbi:Iron (Metal) dependent repressor, DtxR family [uncultured Desulfatiglans sp.]|uniref:Transcriptional regulator MntR n=1 Tax=Uncultured Desulfatiglans sp. TaxID=1748965 RepID=A0A653A5M9_UNCDX|nr:Iron (Metal) dependent repressor, DtxR family [uncultured Desulfatiglans sp.]